MEFNSNQMDSLKIIWFHKNKKYWIKNHKDVIKILRFNVNLLDCIEIIKILLKYMDSMKLF